MEHTAGVVNRPLFFQLVTDSVERQLSRQASHSARMPLAPYLTSQACEPFPSHLPPFPTTLPVPYVPCPHTPLAAHRPNPANFWKGPPFKHPSPDLHFAGLGLGLDGRFLVLIPATTLSPFPVQWVGDVVFVGC